ncbi:MAG: response regulator, partial [Halobacteriota archaeon]
MENKRGHVRNSNSPRCNTHELNHNTDSREAMQDEIYLLSAHFKGGNTVMMRVILIADDPNRTRDIQNRLQRASYDVTTMTVTADEVITRADELRPDVILMDVGLKGETDGVEVARQIKS